MSFLQFKWSFMNYLKLKRQSKLQWMLFKLSTQQTIKFSDRNTHYNFDSLIILLPFPIILFLVHILCILIQFFIKVFKAIKWSQGKVWVAQVFRHLNKYINWFSHFWFKNWHQNNKRINEGQLGFHERSWELFSSLEKK